MQKHILTRHDLVHRIGKTKDGREVVIQDIDLGTLIDDVKNFVKPIVTELKIGIDN